MKIFTITIMALALTLGGCGEMNKPEKEKQVLETTPVQDYVGQGYIFQGGKSTEKFVEAHEKQIGDAAKVYLKQEFGIDVKVNNVVPARLAAVVLVSSEETPEFYTSVTVFLNEKDEEHPVASVRAEEGAVENAIVSGLYKMAYADELAKIDTFVDGVSEKYQVRGMREEAIPQTATGGFTSPYYYISTSALNFPKVYEAFKINPRISADEIKQLFVESDIDPKADTLSINLQLFMSKKGEKADQKIADSVIKGFKKVEGLPRGTYAVFLYGNEIVDWNGMGEGQSVGTTPTKDDIYVY